MKEIVIIYYVVNSMFNKFFRKMNRNKINSFFDNDDLGKGL